jgi:hypothetical protein
MAVKAKTTHLLLPARIVDKLDRSTLVHIYSSLDDNYRTLWQMEAYREVMGPKDKLKDTFCAPLSYLLL